MNSIFFASPCTNNDGWISLSIFNPNKKTISFVGCSYVYDPFYELPSILKAIEQGKKYLWSIDEEGKDTDITFTPYGKRYKITVKHHDKDDKKATFFFVSTERLLFSLCLLGVTFLKNNHKSMTKAKKKGTEFDVFYMDRYLLMNTRSVKRNRNIIASVQKYNIPLLTSDFYTLKELKSFFMS